MILGIPLKFQYADLCRFKNLFVNFMTPVCINKKIYKISLKFTLLFSRKSLSNFKGYVMLKKIVLSAALASAMFAAGGFTGAGSASVTSVANAKTLKDDAPVVLEGKIKSQIRSEHYTFADNKGDTIEIEIDDKDWGGVKVDENTSIRIYGEVDKDFMKDATIDVKRIEIVK